MAALPPPLQPHEPGAAHGVPGEARGLAARPPARPAAAGEDASMVGWARDERVREVVGYEARCEVREGAPQPASRPAGRSVPAGRGRGLRRRHRRLRSRRSRGRLRAGPGGTGRARARVRAPRRPPQLSERPDRGPAADVPRRRPDDRDRQAGDPDPGRAHRRRNDRDQLRAPASAPPRRCWPSGASGTGSSGRPDLADRYAAAERCWRSSRSTRSAWAATASSAWRAPRPSAPAAARSRATPAPACSAAPARSAAASTPSGRPTSPTSRWRWRPAPGSAPGCAPSGVLVEAAACAGSPAGPGTRPPPPRRPARKGGRRRRGRGRCAPRR